MKSPLAAAALIALLSSAAAAATAPPPIELTVDARECARRILHVREVFPARPGMMALAYPKWIPGDHGPQGPIVDVAGIHLDCGGATLPWKRDDVDMHTIRCAIPRGQNTVTLTFDLLLASDDGGVSDLHCATENLLLLPWIHVLFAPTGVSSDATPFHATLTLPEGWESATALETEARDGATQRFATVSLTELADSPLLAGKHFRHVDLTGPGEPPVSLEVACDSKAGLAFADSLIDAHRRLVREARALFGGTHYRRYRFLVSLSDHIAHFGLEHHESSDDRMEERAWVDADVRLNNASLLAHEMSHSWNGKYRRPAPIATADFAAPMKTELLWAYEGLTSYLGWVLSARSGLRSLEDSRDQMALDAAQQDNTRGRDWRPIADTALEADALYNSRAAWSSWRRSTDFYDDAMLVWLDADVTIRRLTHDARSLDDFCRAFFGGTGVPEVKPYAAAELYAALNAVAPYDWANFFHARIETVQSRADLAGLEQSGWRLAFADSTTSAFDAQESSGEMLDESYSIGLWLGAKDGRVIDVVPGSAAEKAGIAPDMKLLAVNGRRWNSDVLHDAIAATAKGDPLELLLENGEFLRAYMLDYKGGRRYPRLVRIDAQPDAMAEILKPRLAR